MTWNFDPSAAPKGHYETRTRNDKTQQHYIPVKIIVATHCGKVFSSRWLPDVERWEGFCKGQEPLAWQPWPEHPGAPFRSDHHL